MTPIDRHLQDENMGPIWLVEFQRRTLLVEYRLWDILLPPSDGQKLHAPLPHRAANDFLMSTVRRSVRTDESEEGYSGCKDRAITLVKA